MRLQRIAEQARNKKQCAFINLAHHIDVEMLREAYCRTRKDGAAGVDGQTGENYEVNLEANLKDLHTRLKTKTYRMPKVRRVYIPKEDGSKRPLGIPTFEDKIVQRAMVMLLEQIYEQDFYDFSYGFRPEKSAHQALQALKDKCWEARAQWIIDADIKGFFDNVSHAKVQELLGHRVNDGSVRNLIGGWLKAGIQEGGITTNPTSGTPQGGVISPLLANIYLHYVLDEWFTKEVQTRLSGKSFLIRYADDFIIGCERKEDAKRVAAVLPKRFERFALALNTEKTRIVPFGKPYTDEENKENGNFMFLGFTHYWDKSHRTGRYYIRRRIAAKRFSRAKRAINQWFRIVRHQTVEDQHKQMCKKIRGHYQYYGIPGNHQRLYTFRREVERAWFKWLNRRGAPKNFDWQTFVKGILRTFPVPMPKPAYA
jgi:RNA-directed DNA polymerase